MVNIPTSHRVFLSSELYRDCSSRITLCDDFDQSTSSSAQQYSSRHHEAIENDIVDITIPLLKLHIAL